MVEQFDLTMAEYARMKGWNQTYVARLTKVGRIALTADGKIKVAIEPAQYQKLKRKNGRPTKAELAAREALEVAAKDVAATEIAAKVSEWAQREPEIPLKKRGPKPNEGNPGEAPTNTLTAARTETESLRGRLLSLRIEKESAKLAAVSEVMRGVADCHALAVKVLRQLPDTLCTPLASESDPQAIHDILSKEIDAAIREIHRGITLLAETAKTAAA